MFVEALDKEQIVSECKSTEDQHGKHLLSTGHVFEGHSNVPNGFGPSFRQSERTATQKQPQP